MRYRVLACPVSQVTCEGKASVCKRVACGIPREDGVSVVPACYGGLHSFIRCCTGEAGKGCWDAETPVNLLGV